MYIPYSSTGKFDYIKVHLFFSGKKNLEVKVAELMFSTYQLNVRETLQTFNTFSVLISPLKA